MKISIGSSSLLGLIRIKILGPASNKQTGQKFVFPIWATLAEVGQGSYINKAHIATALIRDRK